MRRPPTGRMATLSAVSPRKRLAALAVLLVALVVVAVLVTRPKSSTPRSANLSKSAVVPALAGSPAALAVAAHAGQSAALAAAPRRSRRACASCAAIPWSSTSGRRGAGPARPSFPPISAPRSAFGRRVAFIGIDGKDHNAAAAAFLTASPSAIPSYTDPTRRSPAPSRPPPTTPRRSTSTARATRSSITPVPTRPPPRWRRTSGATRCDDRRAHLRGAPRRAATRRWRRR